MDDDWFRGLRLMLSIVLLLDVGPGARADDAPLPPGLLVPVFDASLHLFCTGSGSPPVVLEAGLGANYLDWSLVRPILSAHLRVCGYDRAGAGFSTRTARPRSIANITSELHALVGEAGLATPFILVGHSFGGLLSLGYARRYPADVAALVLLDPMHPDQFDRFAAAGVELDMDPRTVLGRTPVFAATYGLPPDLRDLAMRLAGGDTARVFVVREMWLLRNDADAVRSAGYPRLPSRILVHGKAEWDSAYPDGRMERVWRDLQDELAARIGAPPPLVAANSGHQIALDAPEMVAQAVLAVAEEVERAATRAP